jgi:hypothetical protein
MRIWGMPNQVTALSVLKDARVHEIYKKAGEIIASRGLSSNMVYDPYTKRVDIMGAILLACGASERKMLGGATEVEECDVPPTNHGKVHVAYEYVEAALAQDPSEWCSSHETHEAVSALNKIADRIEISIRIPEFIAEKD